MQTLKKWFPVLVWMGIIFFLSSQPSVKVSDVSLLNFIFFKTLHILEYAMLFLLCFRAGRIGWKAFLITLAYAITDELHQTFIPTREGKLRDVIIDGIGATLSWIILAKLLPKAPPKLRSLAKHWQIW